LLSKNYQILNSTKTEGVEESSYYMFSYIDL